MLSQLVEKQTAFEKSISEEVSCIRQSMTGLSGFVEDFDAKLKAIEKGNSVGRAKTAELEMTIKGLKDSNAKRDGSIKALEGHRKTEQVSRDELLARLIALETDQTERLPPSPDAVPQVLAKRIERLEVTGAVHDQPNQEKVKLDLRITGLPDVDKIPERELLSQVKGTLSKALNLSENEMQVTAVRVHRVRTSRGPSGAQISSPPPSPLSPGHCKLRESGGKETHSVQGEDGRGGAHFLRANPVAGQGEELHVGALCCPQK